MYRCCLILQLTLYLVLQYLLQRTYTRSTGRRSNYKRVVVEVHVYMYLNWAVMLFVLPYTYYIVLIIVKWAVVFL